MMIVPPRSIDRILIVPVIRFPWLASRYVKQMSSFPSVRDIFKGSNSTPLKTLLLNRIDVNYLLSLHLLSLPDHRSLKTMSHTTSDKDNEVIPSTENTIRLGAWHSPQDYAVIHVLSEMLHPAHADDNDRQ